MKDVNVQLMLHDDWEIFGDGTGDIEGLMFKPAKRILDICDRFGAKYTFFAEVGQQFAMLNSPHMAHRQQASEWEEILIEAIQRGHDVQLHLHPQWTTSMYRSEHWELDYSKWSLASLEEDEVVQLFVRGKQYLESLLRSFCPSYETVAFRAGGWQNQPSEAILAAMIKAGLRCDVTVIKGKKISLGKVGSVDFSYAPSAILPWYADPQDVAKSSSIDSGVICIPTYSELMRFSTLPILHPQCLPYYFDVFFKWRKRAVAQDYSPARNTGNLTAPNRLYKGLRSLFGKRAVYCNFGYLHYLTLLTMLGNACDLAMQLNVDEFPLIMLTHSKSFYSYSNFAKLIESISKIDSVTFCSTREVVKQISRNGIETKHLSH